METHLEVKNQLIHNLEDIIDEQEMRIYNMENFIQGLPCMPSLRNLGVSCFRPLQLAEPSP